MNIRLILITCILLLFIIYIFTNINMIPWQWNITHHHHHHISIQHDKVIPNIIWTYWNDSVDTIPELIQRCINTWKKHNPTYEIVIVTPDTVSKWLPGIHIYSLRYATTPQRISDFIRLYLLLYHGGFWVDASTIMFQSLDTFVTQQQETPDVEIVGYYMDGFTTNPNFPVVDSWFIGAVKNSSLIKMWLEEFLRINDYMLSFTYIEHMKWNGISMQNIGFFAYYLAIHAAFQSVIQRHPELTKHLSVRKAEDGPFKYLVKTGWNVEASVHNFIHEDESSYHYTPFIKLRKNERRVLNMILDKVKIL